jgi:hypothetical protein
MKKNYLLAIILLFLLFVSPTIVWANNEVEVNFVYLTQEIIYTSPVNCHAEFKTIDVSESKNPRRILPFASLELIFDHHLTDEEIELFEKEFRIFNITDSKNEAHLHEIAIEGKNNRVPIFGENASFYWREENTKLYYTSEGLEAGKDFEIILPDGWLLKDSQGQFFTKELTGQLRHYSIIVSDLDDWKETSNEKPLTDRMGYVDCILIDHFNHKDYEDAKIRIRGGSSTQFSKKNYTVKFDKDQMFTGFKDSSQEYQGQRRRIVLIANPTWSVEQPLTFFNNRLAYDFMRDIESRKHIYGVGLAPDSYFSLITLNGRFLGVYQFGEHIDVGKGGWSTMKDRQEKLGFDSDGKGLLHKLKRTGDHYPDFGNTFNLIPETEHKYKFDDKGNGMRTQWMGMIPYRYYVQRESGTSFIQPVDIEFKVEADREDGSEMELEPDLSSGESRDYPSFDLEGDGSGLIQREETESYIEIDFNDPVKDGKKVKVEFTTLFDCDQFYAAVRNNKERMFDWMDLDGVLLNIFFVRVAEATDNVGTANNLYFFANHDDLEDYRNVIIPPVKYHTIIWDCNFSFQRALVRFEELDRFKELLQLPPWMQVAQESDIARQRYVDLFYGETEEGGVLTEQYYIDKLNNYMSEIGNAMRLEEIRWNRSFDPKQIYDYIGQQFSNLEYMRNYLLSLKPDQYLPPSMNNDNHPPVFNSVADKEVKTGKSLRFDVSAVDDDKDELIYSAANLPKGATFVNQVFDWIPILGQSGDYDVTFKVNDDKEGEDILIVTIRVLPCSDLVVRDIYESNRRLTIGIKNIGDGQAIGSGHLFIWIDDKLSWTYNLNTLYSQEFREAGGEIIVQPQTLYGTHKIRAQIDALNKIEEIDENNNSKSRIVVFPEKRNEGIELKHTLVEEVEKRQNLTLKVKVDNPHNVRYLKTRYEYYREIKLEFWRWQWTWKFWVYGGRYLSNRNSDDKTIYTADIPCSEAVEGEGKVRYYIYGRDKSGKTHNTGWVSVDVK